MDSAGYAYPSCPKKIYSLPVKVRPIGSNRMYGDRSLDSQSDYVNCSDRSFCDSNDTLDDDSYDGDYSIPDLKLIYKIVNRVEFYLSDENLSNDAFLLKHVQRNKMGFVSIKLITSFKKIKSLTRDWRQTLYALQFSESLEVNEEETKVRRKKPIPESLLEITPSKQLLAWNLENADKPQNILETVTSMFASYGAIISVRIIKPSKEIPCDVKKYLSKYPELAKKNSALVEYENLEGARRALDALNSNLCNTDSFKVIPVSGRGKYKKSCVTSDEIENHDLPDKMVKKHKVLRRFRHTREEPFCHSSSESDSVPASPVLAPNYLTPGNFTNADVSFRPQFYSSPRSSPLLAQKCFTHPFHNLSPLATDLGSRFLASPGTSPEFGQRFPEISNDSGIYSSSPWVQKRRAAANDIHMENAVIPCNSLAGKKNPVSHGLPTGALRLPHGPDGSKGFHNSIGRGKLVLRH
ncbi:la-related protein 6-like [Anomaloglossus baeobatrachus]|uniref:la-related protein 6-like n=1 Tax=Anomaloglossus baeobatrachus TaxID=238106 RepID=UPI003F4FC272